MNLHCLYWLPFSMFLICWSGVSSAAPSDQPTTRRGLSSKQLLKGLRSPRRASFLGQRKHYCALEALGVRLVKEIPFLLKQVGVVAMSESEAALGFQDIHKHQMNVQAGIHAACLLKSLGKRSRKALPTLRRVLKIIAWVPIVIKVKPGRWIYMMRPRGLFNLSGSYPMFWKVLDQTVQQLTTRGKKKSLSPLQQKPTKRRFSAVRKPSPSQFGLHKLLQVKWCGCPKQKSAN